MRRPTEQVTVCPCHRYYPHEGPCVERSACDCHEQIPPTPLASSCHPVNPDTAMIEEGPGLYAVTINDRPVAFIDHPFKTWGGRPLWTRKRLDLLRRRVNAQ